MQAERKQQPFSLTVNGDQEANASHRYLFGPQYAKFIFRVPFKVDKIQFRGCKHPVIDNTAIRDQKCGPPFMHTALMMTPDLNYRRA